MAGNEPSSAELLEAMLKEGEVDFFSTLYKRLDRFVDVFNHDKTQRSLSHHRCEMLRLLENLEQASSVRTMVLGVRDLVDHVKHLGVNSFVDCLCRSGFESLLTCETLDFLDDDDLTVEQMAGKFVELHAKRGQEPQATALALEVVADIQQVYEPLREKLAPLAAANAWTLGAASWLGKIGRAVVKLRRGRPQWFEETAGYLTDVVLRRHDDAAGNLCRFLNDEGLESDLQHFLACIRHWTRRVRRTLPKDNCKLLLEKTVAMAELERSRAFLYAVALNRPPMLQTHRERVADVIRNAAAASSNPKAVAPDESILPCVSYGQLPLPSSSKRSIPISFIVDAICDQQDAECLLGDIAKLFEDVITKSLETSKDGLRQIQLTVDLGDHNVPREFAAIIVKLANLRVRAILIGNMGVAQFRHAMNPSFNRIYSKDRKDTAEGFTPTWFPHSLGRGREPYYCPVGWRRYGIDVGLSGMHFERDYGQWPVAYRGSAGTLSMAILLHGLRASGQGCFILRNQGAIRLSPSIEYCGHPRHAKVVQVQSKYVQMVIQVRVHPLLIEKQPGTLPGATPNNPGRADPNFSNEELEWLVQWKPESQVKALNGILVYGLMFRVTDEDPKTLPQNKWWKECETVLEMNSPKLESDLAA